MMQTIKRPVSILLVFMLIVSLFTVVPISASAATITYDIGVDSLRVGDILTREINQIGDLNSYTLTLSANGFGTDEAAINTDMVFDNERHKGFTSGIVFVEGEEPYRPYVKGVKVDLWIVSAVDHGEETITLTGYADPATAPTEAPTEASAEGGTIYNSGEHDASELNTGDYIVSGIERLTDEYCEYTITLKAGTYTEWPSGDSARDEDYTIEMAGLFDIATDDENVLCFTDWMEGNYMPFVDDAIGNAFYVESADHDAKTITLSGANVPTEAPTPANPQAGDILPESDYLTFTAVEAGSSVKLNVSYGNNLQYNKNNSGWASCNPYTEIALENVGDSVSFSGKDVTYSSSYHVTIDGKVACSGNVMSLRLSDGVIQGLSEFCFDSMFADCAGLTTAPELPETALAPYCYGNMFAGCTSLTAAPELPATTLAENCYACMFEGCESLTTAPKLPATTLADSCYSYMFEGCNSLTAAPEQLPATTLADYCYSGMFSGCKSLTASPELPATALANSCYSSMFYGCESLSELPELPATTLASMCYYMMFGGCSKIYISDEAGTFDGITYSAEYRIPSSGTGESADYALYYMFNSTGGKFKGTPNLNTTYYIPAPAAEPTDAPTEAPTEPAESDDKFVRAQNYEEVNYAASCTKEQAVEWANAHLDELKAERSAAGDKNLWIVYDVNVGQNHAEYIVLDKTGNLVTDGESDTPLTGILSFMRDDGDIIYYAPTVLPENAEALYLFDYYDEDEEEFAAEHTGTNVKITPSTDNIEVSAGWEFTKSLSATISALNGKSITKIEVTTTNPNRVKMTVDGSVVSGTAVGNVVTYDNINATEAVLASEGLKHIVSKIVVYYTDGEPETEPATEAAPTSFTVKFTDALGWGDLHVYYWDNGPEFPGLPMDKAEVNELGQQVYTAVIPADVEGIIFNGNGNQTVDIKENIADGAHWYAINEQDLWFYKVKLVGAVDPTYTVTWKNGDGSTLKTDTVEDGTAPAYSGYVPEKAEDEDFTYTFSGWTDGTNTYGATDTLPAVTGDITYTATFNATAKYEPGYYLVGTFTNWKVDPAYRLTANPEDDGEFMLTNIPLAADDEYKVVYAEAGNYLWYPDGFDNNISVETADNYNIHFRPDGTDDEAWDYGVIFTERYVPAESAAVINLINALPTDVTVDDKEQIEAARNAYDALTNDQKGYIDTDTLKKLTDTEAALAAAEKAVADQTAANAVIGAIIALPSPVTLADKAAVEAAKQAYNDLTDDQKNLVTDGILEKLAAAEAAIADLEAAKAVTDQINALPAEITLNDKAAVEAAKQAYNDLTNDQKNLVTDETLEKLAAAEAAIADLEAAKTVTDQINALPTIVTVGNKNQIEEARAAYNALSDDQKNLVAPETLNKLTDAEAKLSKAIADRNAADAVILEINALPMNITLDIKLDVVSARTAYNNLTDDQKALVNGSVLNKLVAAETKIADLEAAQAVTDQINALPSDLALNDKQAVVAARNAYNALSDDQKPLVDTEALNKLAAAETKIADLEAAMSVSMRINALPSNPTLSNKKAVLDARTAYNNLTDDQKALVDDGDLEKLAAAEAKIADLEAAMSVSMRINALPSNLTLNDKKAVQDARTAYNNLTDAQKALVDNGDLEKLAAAEAKIADLEAAKAVSDQINALPTTVTVGNKNQIEEARAAYNALTTAQKNLVAPETLNKLTDSEAKLAKAIADKNAADAVTDQINNLPADIKLSDEQTVEDARAAYNALTDDQKALLTTETLKKLTDAEDMIAAATVAKAINDLPASDEIATSDKDAIEAARQAYDALTDAQKDLVDSDTLKKLTDSEDALAAATVTETISSLPAPDEVTTSDKDAIEAARQAYDALTDDQKDLVDDDTLKKLTDNEDALAAATVTETISSLPAPDEVTTSDKDAIEAARQAYDALTDDQKAYLDEDTLKKLTDNEDHLAAATVTATINALPDPDKVTTSNIQDIKAAKDAFDALTDEQKAIITNEIKDKLNGNNAAITLVVSIDNWTYGKTAKTPSVTGNVSNGEVTYTYKVKGADDSTYTETAPTDAGNYTVKATVPAAVGFDGDEATADFVINKAPLTVIARNKTISYGEALPKDWYFIKGLVKGDQVTVKVKTNVAQNATVPTVTNCSNYVVTTVNGLLGIKGSPTANARPSGNSIIVNFSTTKNADGYMIYAGYCGSGSYPLVKTIKGNSTHSVTLTKIGGKAIDTRKNVFLYVVAYKNVNGKKITIVRSASVRVAGTNSKYTNAKTLTVNKTAVTLNAGKQTTLKAQVTPANAKKILLSPGIEVSYASSNKSVAKVDKNGKITAVAKGTANIYVCAANGLKKKVVVTVK